MKKNIMRALRIGLGSMFLLAGVAGLFLPVVQGLLLILIGLTILSTEWKLAGRFLAWLRNRFPSHNRRLTGTARPSDPDSGK